jgi:alpha-tubulin suppressor-like RCC1 family protein
VHPIVRDDRWTVCDRSATERSIVVAIRPPLETLPVRRPAAVEFARGRGIVTRTMTTRTLLLTLLFTVACGDDAVDPPDGATLCVADRDCSDGAFCNGIERCGPGNPLASAIGCVAGPAACLDGQSCDESGNRCVTECDVTEDADGDGVLALDCGGDDCNDANADAFPGAIEVCDSDGVDEDCDPSTLGGVDEDGDGFVDARCCNGAACGDDCDDRRNDVKPGQVEICDRYDNDCDGTVDEMAADVPWYPDCDGDLYGAAGATPVMSCREPSGFPEGCGDLAPLARWSINDDDCDDTVPVIRPNAPQICDVYGDNQCGTANPHDVDGDGFDRLGCGGNDCDDTDASRNPAVASDPCDGVDEDCDLFGEDEDGDGFYAIGATCEGDVERTDCDDLRADVGPGFEEICDGVDNDCDGDTDEGADAYCQSLVPVGLGEGVCVMGACQATACPATNRDCNGVAEDGCEAPIQFDPDNCGGCGNVCDFACDRQACIVPLGVTAGTSHGCVLAGDPAPAATDGDIFCWGDNPDGQLGIGTFGGIYTVPTPIVAPTDTTFRHVRTSREHTCAIDAMDRVWCWGSNVEGRLGQPSGLGASVPIEVQDTDGAGQLDQALTLELGGSFGCVLRPDGDGDGDPTDGTVWCWGRNLFGELGDGSTANSARPVQVLRDGGPDPLTDVVAISAGRRFACAIDTSAELWCWGDNREGQLGRGFANDTRQTTAVRVQNPEDTAALSSVAAVRAGDELACAIDTEDRLYCWGKNDQCQLLDCGAPSASLPVRMEIGGAAITDAAAVALGKEHVCVHREGSPTGDETVWCWGGAQFTNEVLGRGALGDEAERFTPMAVAGGFATSAPVELTALNQFNCARRADDVVLCWGDNLNGQLGTGDRSDRFVPAPLARPLF